MPSPVLIPSNLPFNPVTFSGGLIMGPAERADLIVDFSGFAGQKLILYSDAPAPFPVGDPLFDYFLGNPATPTIAGSGPDTRQILQFEVAANVADGFPADPFSGTIMLPVPPDVDAPLVNQVTGVPTVPVARMRSLTLNEQIDDFGRLIQMLGTDVPPFNLGQGFGRTYDGTGDRGDKCGSRRNMGDIQPHGRHAPDALPPSQRADSQPAAVQGEQLQWRACAVDRTSQTAGPE